MRLSSFTADRQARPSKAVHQQLRQLRVPIRNLPHGQAALPSSLDVTLVRLRSQREEITFPRVKIDLLIAPVSFNVVPSDFEYSSRSLPACQE